MRKEVCFQVELRLTGMVLSKASGAGRWGVDQAVNRNHENKPVLNGSQIKGKLRETWTEFARLPEVLAGLGLKELDPDAWLGGAPKSGTTAAHPARLQFSDFELDETASGFRANTASLVGDSPTVAGQRTRLKIDPKRGAAVKGALVVEERLSHGDTSIWKGTIRSLLDDAETEDVRKLLKAGLRWQTALGGGKSTGLGRLLAVSILDECVQQPVAAVGKEQLDGSRLNLELEIHEPFYAGGLRQGDNFLVSRMSLSGAVLKGSLARGLNERFVNASATGTGYLRSGISASHPAADRFPLLCRYFSQLQILEARASSNGTRPGVPSLSLALNEDQLIDLAMDDAPHGSLLRFQPDWSRADWDRDDVSPDQGKLRIVEQVRTAINQQGQDGRFHVNPRQKAEDSKLFSQRRLMPEAGVRFRSVIVLPEIAEQAALAKELQDALALCLYGVGKGHSRVTARVTNAGQTPEPVTIGIWRLVLQTPALLLDPVEVFPFKNRDLQPLYEQWLEELGGGHLRLKRRFCLQKFEGGFQGRRYADRRFSTSYAPILLEQEGSCLVLEVLDQEGCRIMERVRSNGLSLPGWVHAAFGGDDGKASWKSCPWLPENGFGEVQLTKLEENR